MLKWDDKLSLGVASIDDEHKYLVFLAGEIVKAAKAGSAGKALVLLVSKLREYTVTHFRNEEEYMAGIHFPGLMEHHRRHQELKRRVMEYQDSLYRKREVTAEEIMAFMKEWLVDHIIYMDMDIAKYLKKQADAQEAGDAGEQVEAPGNGPDA